MQTINYQNIENQNNSNNSVNLINSIRYNMKIILITFDIFLIMIFSILLGISVSSNNKLNDVLISTNCTTLNDYQVIINTDLINFPTKELIVYSPFKNSKIGEYSCKWNPCYLDLDHFYNGKTISCENVIKNRPVYYDKIKIIDLSNIYSIVMICLCSLWLFVDLFKFYKIV